MSGIYISGMEMPTDEPLLVKINPDGSVSTTARNGYKKYTAVPVPEHGRLVDADALKASLVFAEETAEWAVPALRAVLMVIDEMPTIIPADKEG